MPTGLQVALLIALNTQPDVAPYTHKVRMSDTRSKAATSGIKALVLLQQSMIAEHFFRPSRMLGWTRCFAIIISHNHRHCS